jgi:hypothetical protein
VPRINPHPLGVERLGYPAPHLFICKLVFIDRMYVIMKLQDYFPFDNTLLGLENLYSEVGENSFFVNSNSVVARGKILTKQKHYLIFNIPTKTDIKMTEIVLIDLFYYKNNIHLISQDIHTKRVSNLSLCLECPTNDCRMFVVDINYFIDRMNERAIRDYCSCDTNKQKPIKEGKTNFTDDLLEFDF